MAVSRDISRCGVVSDEELDEKKIPNEFCDKKAGEQKLLMQQQEVVHTPIQTHRQNRVSSEKDAKSTSYSSYNINNIQDQKGQTKEDHCENAATVGSAQHVLLRQISQPLEPDAASIVYRPTECTLAERHNFCQPNLQFSEDIPELFRDNQCACPTESAGCRHNPCQPVPKSVSDRHNHCQCQPISESFSGRQDQCQPIPESVRRHVSSEGVKKYSFYSNTQDQKGQIKKDHCRNAATIGSAKLVSNSMRQISQPLEPDAASILYTECTLAERQNFCQLNLQFSEDIPELFRDNQYACQTESAGGRQKPCQPVPKSVSNRHNPCQPISESVSDRQDPCQPVPESVRNRQNFCHPVPEPSLDRYNPCQPIPESFRNRYNPCQPIPESFKSRHNPCQPIPESARVRHNPIYNAPSPYELGLGTRVRDDNGDIDLTRAREERRRRATCLSCWENIREVLLIPCGHCVLCKRCFLEPEFCLVTQIRCPQCMQNVTSIKIMEIN